MKKLLILTVLIFANPAMAQENEGGSSVGDDDIRSGSYSNGQTYTDYGNHEYRNYSETGPQGSKNCQTIRSGSYVTTQCY